MTLAALLMSILPHDVAVVAQCDLVEVNHFYDENGRLVFDQMIFYDWCPAESRYHVAAWRMIKSPQQTLHRDWSRQIPGTPAGWYVIWHDGETPRDVRAAAKRETWTQCDPELLEREFLPKEKRRELGPWRMP